MLMSDGADSTRTVGFGERSVTPPAGTLPRLTVLLLSLVLLAACQQAQGFGSTKEGDSTSNATRTASLQSSPANLVPGGAGSSLSQVVAQDLGSSTVVDRQGVTWSVQIGTPYDSAVGKPCKPLRFSSLSRAGSFDRIACQDSRGAWALVAPLQGGNQGPDF